MVQNQNNIEKLLTSKAINSLCLLIFGSFKPIALDALVFSIVKNNQILHSIIAKCKTKARQFDKHADKIYAFLELNKDDAKELCITNKSLIGNDLSKTMPLERMVALCLLLLASEHEWEDESDNQDQSRYYDYEMDFDNFDDFLTWLEVVELSDEAKVKDDNEGADHEDLDDLEEYKNPFGNTDDINEDAEIEDLDLDFELDLNLTEGYETEDLSIEAELEETLDRDSNCQSKESEVDLETEIEDKEANASITEEQDEPTTQKEDLQKEQDEEGQEESLSTDLSEGMDEEVTSHFESFLESLSQLIEDSQEEESVTYYNSHQNQVSLHSAKHSRASFAQLSI